MKPLAEDRTAATANKTLNTSNLFSKLRRVVFSCSGYDMQAHIRLPKKRCSGNTKYRVNVASIKSFRSIIDQVFHGSGPNNRQLINMKDARFYLIFAGYLVQRDQRYLNYFS